MPAWKVMLIGLFAMICFSLALGCGLVLMIKSGGEMWAWFGGLFAATLVASGLFALFLRSADRAMDRKPAGSRRSR